MKRFGLTIVAVLLGTLAVSAAEPVAWQDNLFLNAGAGIEKPPGEDSTGFMAIGFNWGLPLNAESDGVAWGAQVGGDVTFREDDPEWSQTLGVFCRKLASFGDEEAALAVLFDYTHTAFGNDVWAFRPVLGTTISDQDAIGVTAIIGLNDDDEPLGESRICQECADQFELFWNRDWNEAWASELGVGYQFGDVDETIFNGVLVYAVNDGWDVAGLGSVNTAGHYLVGVRVSYHFGQTRRHDVLHNIDGAGAGRFTPFPKRRPLEVAVCATPLAD